MKEMTPAKVIAVNISAHKGEKKTPVDEVLLLKDHGIDNDAHAGNGHRQVSLLANESIDKMRRLGLDVDSGSFAENLTIQGVDLTDLPVGRQIQVGETLIEITQIGKECHNRCAIYYQAGDCVMPKEGVFGKVIKGGIVRPGDPVEVL